MNFYLLWPYFACMAALLAMTAIPTFSFIESADGPGRSRKVGIDGLRGLLALNVFFHHAAFYYQYVTQGTWQISKVPPFFVILGQSGVAVFFMITGYLFWAKVLAENGWLQWTPLYIGRLFRIGPLYIVAVAVMLLLVFSRQGYVLQESPFVVFKQLIHWALLGADRTNPDVNGYRETSLLLAGVTWTLSFEWSFYASLLVLAFASRRGPKVALAAVAAAFVAAFILLLLQAQPIRETSLPLCSFLFLCGMLVASMEANNLSLRLPEATLSALTLGVLAILFATCEVAYAPLPALLLFAAFYLVASGADLFGLLACTPARRLGNISFGIYLLQGLVLTVVFSAGGVSSFAVSSPTQFWLVILCCVVLLTLVASLTHVLVELPGIAAGRRLARPFRRAKATRSSMP